MSQQRKFERRIIQQGPPLIKLPTVTDEMVLALRASVLQTADRLHLAHERAFAIVFSLAIAEGLAAGATPSVIRASLENCLLRYSALASGMPDPLGSDT